MDMHSTLDIFGTFSALQSLVHEGFFNLCLFVHNIFLSNTGTTILNSKNKDKRGIYLT